MGIERAAQMAADWWGDREKFVTVLRPMIEEKLRERPDAWIRLENDYDPRGILLAAVRKIGIECRGFMFSGDGIFPRKHELIVYADRLKPKEGYGNFTDEIPVTD